MDPFLNFDLYSLQGGILGFTHNGVKTKILFLVTAQGDTRSINNALKNKIDIII